MIRLFFTPLHKDPVIAAAKVHRTDRDAIYDIAFRELQNCLHYVRESISAPSSEHMDEVCRWVGSEKWLYRFLGRLGGLCGRRGHRRYAERCENLGDVTPIWFGSKAHMSDICKLIRLDDYRRLKDRARRQQWSYRQNRPNYAPPELRPQTSLGRFAIACESDTWQGEELASFGYFTMRALCSELYQQSFDSFFRRNRYLSEASDVLGTASVRTVYEYDLMRVRPKCMTETRLRLYMDRLRREVREQQEDRSHRRTVSREELRRVSVDESFAAYLERTRRVVRAEEPNSSECNCAACQAERQPNPCEEVPASAMSYNFFMGLEAE